MLSDGLCGWADCARAVNKLCEGGVKARSGKLDFLQDTYYNVSLILYIVILIFGAWNLREMDLTRDKLIMFLVSEVECILLLLREVD